jgi:drug/metabolite transporter (DMT)-like permease
MGDKGTADKNLQAYICLTITAFCWGCNAVFARLVVGEVSPMLVVSLRWFGAVSLLLIFARNAIRKDWPMLKNHLPVLFLLGALGFTAFNALFYVSAYTTTALNIGIIQGSIPIFVLLGAYLIYKNPVTKLQIVGVLVTVLGVCIVASSGDLKRLASLSIKQGDYLMIIACLLYSGYALNLRRFTGTSPLSLFAVIAAAAFISSLPLSLIEYFFGNFQAPTPKGWLIVALITLLPSFIAQICFIQGVSILGAGRAGIFVNLVPVFAAILAVLILREPFELYHGIALLLVVGGILLSERNRSKNS